MSKLEPTIDKPINIVLSVTDTDAFINDCHKIYDLYKSNPKSHNTYCGIDIEFNMNWKLKKRYIAFIQIIFIFDKNKYFNEDTTKPVYIFNPRKLDRSQLDLFIKYILCSGIIKIFHGSDSLDYSHIFNEILKGSKKKFMRFINTSVDTRFLCELSKRFMERSGYQLEESNRCSLYYALFNHNVVDRKLFNLLEQLGSKIDYNKLWLLDHITYDQLIYAAYDVYYLYDLLYELTNRMQPDLSEGTYDDNNITIDIVSLVNRLYRFHMINKLGMCSIFSKCEKLFATKKLPKNDVIELDKKIMEKKLCTTLYRQNDDVVKKIDTYIEDVLSISTIKKSILYILRLYRLDVSKDTEYVDNLFASSKSFKFMKGHESILNIIDIIKHDTQKIVNNIQCNHNILIPIQTKI